MNTSWLMSRRKPTSGPRTTTPRRRATAFVATLALAVPTAVYVASSASAATCANQVTGSNFEIDPTATSPPTRAAASTGSRVSDRCVGASSSSDKPTGPADDAFGQGTSENDANPTIVAGSIPPNKSDLKISGSTPRRHARRSSSSCSGRGSRTRPARPTWTSSSTRSSVTRAPRLTNCANNGGRSIPETRCARSGDKLITYDLAKGGTVPTISIRTWGGVAWGAATPSAEPSTARRLGQHLGHRRAAVRRPREPGPPTHSVRPRSPSRRCSVRSARCGTFGSAYLKSRSSTRSARRSRTSSRRRR